MVSISAAGIRAIVMIAMLVVMQSVSASPRVIVSDIAVSATSSGFTVTWRTDQPADSRLFYSAIRGQITGKYCSVLVDDTAKVEHQLSVTHLTSGLPLWVRLESHAEGAAPGTSPVLTVQTRANIRNFIAVGPANAAAIETVDVAAPSLGDATSAGEWQYIGDLADDVPVGRLLNVTAPGEAILAVYLWSDTDVYARMGWRGSGDATLSMNDKPIGEYVASAEAARLPSPLQRGWNKLVIRLKVTNADDWFNAEMFAHPDDEPIAFSRMAYIDPSPRFVVEVNKLEGDRRDVSWKFVHPQIQPRWIMSGWETPTIQQLAAVDLQQLQEQHWYFDGMTIRFENDHSLTPYGGFWPFDTSSKVTAAGLESQIAAFRRLKLTRWRHNFLWVSAYLRHQNQVDWLFDDAQWQAILDNFRVVANIARETGAKGIFFDCETAGKSHLFNYSAPVREQYPDAQKVMDRAFARGEELMAELQKIVPDIVIIGVDSSRVDLYSRSVLNFHWGEESKSSVTPGQIPPNSKHRLFASLTAGMTAAAHGQSMVIDGEYHVRAGSTLEAPGLSSRAWFDVLPHWHGNPDVRLAPEAWIRHGGISGRTNTYDAPGRDRMDAGMTEKLVSLSRGSAADYLWIYWQSVVPGYGWHELYWLSAERKAEMNRKLKAREIKSFVPNVLTNEPAEMFSAIAEARRRVEPSVRVSIGSKLISEQSDGRIELSLADIAGHSLELVGQCDAGEVRKTVTID